MFEDDGETGYASVGVVQHQSVGSLAWYLLIKTMKYTLCKKNPSSSKLRKFGM